MSENISQSQHITELDFDISRIYSQMAEIERALMAEGTKLQEIIKGNWKIGDVLNDKGSINIQAKQATEQLNTYNKLTEKVTSLQRLKEQFAKKNMTEIDFEIKRQEILGKTQSEQIKSQMQAQSEFEKKKDAFAKSNLNAIDYEIQKREEESKRFSAQIKSQMETQVNAEKRNADISKQAYAINEKAYSLFSKLTNAKSKDAMSEKQKLAVIKDQSDELVKQLQLNGKLTEEQKQQLAVMQKELQESQNATAKISNIGNGTNYTMGDRLKSYISYGAYSTALNLGQNALTSVKDVESVMSEMSRVMSLSNEQTGTLKNNLFGLSKEYGRSFEDVAEVSLRYAQAGYSMNDIVKATRTSLLALNTSELDVENSTNSMIGILQQWGYTANDLAGVMDKLNYTADNSAITTQDLVDGLLNASSVAKTANVSFNDTVGVLTAMKEASGRSGKEVGNAFKSILSYIQRPKSLELFDSMGIDVYADKVTGKLLPMMTILQNMADKYNTSGQEMINTLVDSGDAAQMMSEEWAIAAGATDELTQYNEALAESSDTANTAEKRAQATAAAGVHRKNYYLALMDNMKKAINVSKELDDTTGYSAKENSRYMETVQAKINQLTTALKELAVQFADAGAMDVAKDIIDITSRIVEVTKSVGGLRTALLMTFSVLQLIKGYNTIKSIAGVQVGIKNLSSNIKAMGTAAKTTGLTINSMLGIVGLAATVISAISGAISAHNQKQEEMKQQSREAAEKANEEYESFKKLADEYQALGAKTSKTADEKSRLKEIQDELIKTYGLESDGLDLVNGKYSENIAKITEQQKVLLRAATNEQMKVTNDYNDEFHDNTSDALAKSLDSSAADLLSKIDGISIKDRVVIKGQSGLIGVDKFGKDLYFNGDAVQRYVAATKALEALKAQGITTGNTFGALVTAQTDYKKQTDDLNNSLTTEISQLQTTGDNISRLNDDKGMQLYIEKQLYALQSSMSKETPKQLKSSDIDSAADAQEYYAQQAANSTSASEQQQEALEKLNATYEELSKQISSTEKEIFSLNNVINEANNGTALSGEQIMQLLEQDASLIKSVKEVSGGYTIEKSALESLRDARIDAAVKARQNQLDISNQTLISTIQNIDAYSKEVQAIHDLASAKQALVDITAKQEILRISISSASDAEDYKKMLATGQTTTNLIDKYIAKLAQDKKDLATIQKIYKTITSSSSKSGSSSSSSSKSATNALNDLTKAFENLNSLGIYSIQQQIAYYENLRKNTKLTLDELQSVEKTLQGLYKKQFNERLALLDKEKDKRISAIEASYDKEIQRLKDLKEARDKTRETEDYNTQRAKLQSDLSYWQQRTGADASKNVLEKQKEIAELDKERKRKLEDESIDSQISKLEVQKDKEIKVIEEKYNKIKELMTNANIEMIATAGVFAKSVYDKINAFLVNPFTNDLNNFAKLIGSLGNVAINVKSNTGKNPTTQMVSTSTKATATKASTVSAKPMTIGDKVKILSSAKNYGGQSTNVPIPNSNKNKAYTIASIGYSGKQALIKELFSWVNISDLVKARTGGKALEDGAIFMRKDEFVVRPDLTKWLEKKASQDSSITNDNSNKTVINYNAPLYNVEKQEIADGVDADMVSGQVKRALMKSTNRKV